MSLKRKVRTTVLFTLVLVLALVPSCRRKPTPDEQPGEAPPTPPVESPLQTSIGALLPLTGEHKAEGEALLRGLQQALRTHGATATVTVGPLEIRDYGDSPADVLGLARDLIEIQRTPVIFGPLDARGVESIEELARQRKVAVLTPVSAPLKLNVVGSTVWRLSCSDEEEGVVMAQFAMNKRLTTAVVIVDAQMPASEVRARTFAETYTTLGGQVVSQLSYDGKDTDFRRIVRMAAYPKPDVFYVPGARIEAAAILEHMKEEKIFGSVIGSTDWEGDVDFPSEVGPGFSVFVPTWFQVDRRGIFTAEFVKNFKETHGRNPRALEALGYDAGLIALDTLSRVGDTPGKTPDEVAAVKLLSGATGQFTARQWSLATTLTVMRLKGTQFVFEAEVPIK